MRPWAHRSWTMLALVVSSAAYSAAQAPGVISRIVIEGNRRQSTESLQALIHTHLGDIYNEETLRSDVKALWDTHYFEDVRLEVENDNWKGTQSETYDAKVVIFKLVERPIIRRIEFYGIKSVPEEVIENRLKDFSVGVSIETPFDPANVKKAEAAIKQLELEHDHESAVVTSTYEKIPSTNDVKLTFTVDEKPPKSK